MLNMSGSIQTLAEAGWVGWQAGREVGRGFYHLHKNISFTLAADSDHMN